MEMNEFMDDRVILYGHPGLCKTSERASFQRRFPDGPGPFSAAIVQERFPRPRCIQGFKLKEGYDVPKLAGFFKTLLDNETCEAALANVDRVVFKDFIEELYTYWRRRERFVIYDRDEKHGSIDLKDYHQIFIEANEQFKFLVLNTYRSDQRPRDGGLVQGLPPDPVGNGNGPAGRKDQLGSCRARNTKN